MRYYIAYGSNLNKNQMQMRCPGAKAIGTANLVGYKLAFKGSKTGSFLTIEENPDSLVPVAVWRVTKAHEAALDRYEGYPVFYHKKDVIVSVNGKAINAFVYIMDESRPYGVPSKYYVDICREGYMDFALDDYYLYKAVEEVTYGKKVS